MKDLRSAVMVFGDEASEGLRRFRCEEAEQFMIGPLKWQLPRQEKRCQN